MSSWAYSLGMIGILFLTLFLHELGHYVEAKRQGIYKGWGLLPNPHIKLKVKFASRWSYLSGLWFSWLPFPLWFIVTRDVPQVLWLFWLMWIALSSLDLLVVLFYGKLKKRAEEK